ncbi:hypothetical protein F5B21DRAFT_31101 [Xylaria acuta]|nr:hypothetical protein F5B21DRAFT_31101 [Xylaria acuta]
MPSPATGQWVLIRTFGSRLSADYPSLIFLSQARLYYLSSLRLALFTESVAFPESNLHQAGDHYLPRLRTYKYKIMAYVTPSPQDTCTYLHTYVFMPCNRASSQRTELHIESTSSFLGKEATYLILRESADQCCRSRWAWPHVSLHAEHTNLINYRASCRLDAIRIPRIDEFSRRPACCRHYSTPTPTIHSVGARVSKTNNQIALS